MNYVTSHLKNICTLKNYTVICCQFTRSSNEVLNFVHEYFLIYEVVYL